VPKDWQCEICITSKSTKRKPTSTTDIETRSESPFELIHSDLRGKFSKTSFGKSNYYVTFIDDCTRYARIYPIHAKSDTVKVFTSFIYTRYAQDNAMIKRFRTDNGGEYVNAAMLTLLDKQGIVHDLTPAYSHESNGVAERYHQTIITAARSLLTGLPMTLWAEAIATAVYLRNRIPNQSIGKTTPYESLYNKKPSINHLRPYRTKCFVHLPVEKRQPGTKLLSRAIEGYLIGYTSSDKIYRVYIPSQHKVTETRQIHWTNKTILPLETTAMEPFLAEKTYTKDQGSTTTTTTTYEKDSTLPYQQPTHPPLDVTEPLPDKEGPRKSGRVTRPPTHFGRNTKEMPDEDPTTYRQAVNSSLKERWTSAMDDEINALKKNNKPTGRNIVGSKWVFKTKKNADGTLERFRARAVAQGFSQAPGFNFEDTFAPVIRYELLRLLLAICARNKWRPRQFDVKSAFLYGKLKEEVYMRPPPGFSDGDKVWKLNRCIDGLKQSANEWYALFAKFLTSKDFTASHQDPCMFIHNKFDCYISLYMNDIAIYSADTPHLTTLIKGLKTAFEILDLGEASFLLDLHITYTPTGITLTQELYIGTILSRFGMENSNTVSIPLPKGIIRTNGTMEQPKEQVTMYQSMIGSLMYLVTGTKPDLAYTISFLVQFSSCPTEEHIKAAKHVFRYVNRTRNLGLFYPYTTTNAINVYVDADFAGCHDTRRSTSGYIVLFNNCCISWLLKK